MREEMGYVPEEARKQASKQTNAAKGASEIRNQKASEEKLPSVMVDPSIYEEADDAVADAWFQQGEEMNNKAVTEYIADENFDDAVSERTRNKTGEAVRKAGEIIKQAGENMRQKGEEIGEVRMLKKHQKEAAGKAKEMPTKDVLQHLPYYVGETQLKPGVKLSWQNAKGKEVWGDITKVILDPKAEGGARVLVKTPDGKETFKTLAALDAAIEKDPQSVRTIDKTEWQTKIDEIALQRAQKTVEKSPENKKPSGERWSFLAKNKNGSTEITTKKEKPKDFTLGGSKVKTGEYISFTAPDGESVVGKVIKIHTEQYGTQQPGIQLQRADGSYRFIPSQLINHYTEETDMKRVSKKEWEGKNVEAQKKPDEAPAMSREEIRAAITAAREARATQVGSALRNAVGVATEAVRAAANRPDRWAREAAKLEAMSDEEVRTYNAGVAESEKRKTDTAISRAGFDNEKQTAQRSQQRDTLIRRSGVEALSKGLDKTAEIFYSGRTVEMPPEPKQEKDNQQTATEQKTMGMADFLDGKINYRPEAARNPEPKGSPELIAQRKKLAFEMQENMPVEKKGFWGKVKGFFSGESAAVKPEKTPMTEEPKRTWFGSAKEEAPIPKSTGPRMTEAQWEARRRIGAELPDMKQQLQVQQEVALMMSRMKNMGGHMISERDAAEQLQRMYAQEVGKLHTQGNDDPNHPFRKKLEILMKNYQ